MTLFLICLFCWLVMGICGCSIVFYKNREDLLYRSFDGCLQKLQTELGFGDVKKRQD